MSLMLVPSKLKLVEELVAGSSKEELIWLSGYLAGLVANKPVEQDKPSQPLVNKITIAYGTETGNAKKLASEFAFRAKKKGINAKLIGLDQYRLNDLPKEECFLTVISTQGEGDPPAAAQKFYNHIHANGFKLEKLKYGVLALGDTSYPLFCKAGEDVDQQLNKLGAQRIVPLQKCDTDFEVDADQWFEHVLQQLSISNASLPKVASTAVKKQSGKKTYRGTVLTNVNLNDRGSAKETHHIEIAAEEIEYLPGDSLGVLPENATELVNNILELIGIPKEHIVLYKEQETNAFELLKKKLNIYYLPERVVSKYAGLVEQDIPVTRIGLFDLLKIYPLKESQQFNDLVELLEPISPRLYSISSSSEAHSGEVHITVAKDKFAIDNELKYGLCSDYLSQLTVDAEFEFYIHKNAQFRLPANDKDVIMIGPGTGIAPFRSFLAHREATGATGRNWLFFGDQHFVTDFLYQTEIQNWLHTGVLTKVDLAFSRDQKEKVYVQHKINKKGEEFYQWLQSGAYVYICGAKDPMSVDVENTLMALIHQFGGKTQDEAISYLNKLKEEGRYLKDVY
jgi:sulfite reductase (NADPH) flavoprotein alpha-component